MTSLEELKRGEICWILTETGCQNHFHPDYFKKIQKCPNPKLDKVAMTYRFAKEQFEKSNRNIFNATKGGKLEIFKRVNYESLFFH